MPRVNYPTYTPANNPAAPDGGNGPGHSAAYPQHQDDSGISWWWRRAESLASDAYHAGRDAVHEVEDLSIRTAYVAEAVYYANDYAGGAIKAKLGMEIEELKRAFIPGLLISLAILAVTTLGGAIAGGVLAGVLSGGALAVPAAVAGGELGLDAGFLILDALGIGFLLKEVIDAVPRILHDVLDAVSIAWNAGRHPHRPAITDIDTAARHFAEAVAELVSAAMEGVVIWLLSKSAVARSGKLGKAAGNLSDPALLAARGREVTQQIRAKSAETETALRSAVDELTKRLRQARLITGDLATFIENKILQIVDKVSNQAGEKAKPFGKGDGGGEAKSTANSSADGFGKVPPTVTTQTGHSIHPTPGQTTTILGRFDRGSPGGMDDIVNNQLQYPKTTDFGAKPDGYNVLNTPDSLYQTPDQFWNDYNKPFLDDAIQRGDPIAIASDPTNHNNLINFDDGTPTGFSREIKYLEQNGYVYDPSSSTMVKP